MTGTSAPLTTTQVRAALRKFGCKVRYIDGWETRNRGQRGNGFGPVYGFMVHHTGDDAPDSADRNVIVNGRSDLPGPLAQFGLNDDGTVDVIGHGRANHAGLGDSDVLAAVRDESYGTYPPKPNERDFDGNGRFYGVETYYSGGHAPAQYAAMVNLAAAICDAHGWTAKSVIGHKEWTASKWDPGAVDMARFRSDVAARIRAVNGTTPTPTPAPTPAPTPTWEDTEMLTPDAIKQLRAVVREELDAERTATMLWTGHNIVKDTRSPVPDVAERVTPSTLLEAAAAHNVIPGTEATP